MAVTVLIRQPRAPLERQSGGAGPTLTLDAPRIVIGRSKSCDIQLPDPSVSPRHASIRLQGGKNLVMDEGSQNGVLVMTPGDSRSAAVRLPPQTPRALSDGDFIRIGRVWLEVRFCVGVPSTPADVQAVACEVLRHALEEDGEPCAARLDHDGQSVLTLSDPGREYVLGRARDAALQLADELASRRHAVIARGGAGWMVRDLGSKRGTRVDGQAANRAGTPLSDGSEVAIGETTFVFRDPLLAALDEMRKADDVKLPADALPATPPGLTFEAPVVEAPAEGSAADAPDDAPDELEETGPSALDRLAEEPRGPGFAAIDALLVLIALSVLGASALGLAYVLG